MTPPTSPAVPADFLSPTGSITPAVAGAFVLLITNTLGAVFNVPRAWTALILSGIIGGLIVAKFPGSIVKRTAYWVVNSLTIFAIAMGSNATLTGLAGGRAVAAPTPSGGFWTPWL